MRRIRWHTKRDNAVLLARCLEVGRVVAFMPIEDQKTMATILWGLYVLIEVLDPLEARPVIGLAVFGRSDSPIAREVAFLIPAGEVMLARNHDERVDHPPFCVDSWNDCNPFPVSRLD